MPLASKRKDSYYSNIFSFLISSLTLITFSRAHKIITFFKRKTRHVTLFAEGLYQGFIAEAISNKNIVSN